MHKTGWGFLVILIVSFLPHDSWPALLPLSPYEADRQQRLDDVVAACVQKTKLPSHQDPICEALFTMKQIGDDSIEFVKAYFNLSPTAYTVLTVANAVTTGRVRIKTKCFWLNKADEIYDFKPGTFTYTIEKSF